MADDTAAIDAKDEQVLASLGYHQELKRNITFLGSWGCVLGLGMAYGGPVTVVWGFVGCFLMSTCLVLSMAEISSPYTVAGGPYFWSAALAGRWGAFPPYVVGWVTLLGFLGGVASIALQTMQSLFAMRMISASGAEESSGTQTQQWAVAESIVFAGFLASLLPTKYIEKISRACLALIFVGVTLIVIVVPATAPHHPTRQYVFGRWYNGKYNQIAKSPIHGSRSQDAYTFCNGLLMAQYLLLVYDVPGHLAEETKHASWSVPRAICATFFSGAAMNFALILAFLYSIQIEPNVTVPGCGITGVRYQGSGTGTTFTSTDEKDAPIYYTLFLFSNIVYDAFAARFPDREAQLADSSCTLQYSNLGGFCVVPGLCDVNGNCAPDTLGPDGTPSGCPLRGNHKARQGAVFFTFIIFLALIGSMIQIHVAASRFIYAFARDRGLPIPWLAKVNPNTGVPVNATVCFGLFAAAFVTCWLNPTPSLAFNAVSGVNSNGFLFTYGVPPFLRVTESLRSFVATRDFNLGPLSVFFAIVGVMYTVASNATIALPGYWPISPHNDTLGKNLSFAPIALGSVISIAVVTYPLSKRPWWNYRGPSIMHQEDWTVRRLQARADLVDAPVEDAHAEAALKTAAEKEAALAAEGDAPVNATVAEPASHPAAE